MTDTLATAVRTLTEAVPNPSKGLPDEVFYYISATTPLINVDLLIKDELGRTLLAWRDDRYAGAGWHIPGGIIRFRETIAERIRQVALSEIGVGVEHDPEVLCIQEMINPNRNVRGHFISLLYNCRLPSTFAPANTGLTAGDAGYLQWHARCPDDMIVYHDVYRKYI